MQGIIFNVLADFVVENFGMATWNNVLEKSAVPSGGRYTSGATYADEEAVALATTIAAELNISVSDALKAFGEYLFPQLLSRGPIVMQEYTSLQDLLTHLDETVHAEVKRVTPDAYLPAFEFFSSGDKGRLVYRSKRKMCAVAEGLLAGSAKHFDQKITIDHFKCMHHGHEQCEWNISFVGDL
ncbi:MAG: heme NO-binding domain-containing protein [Oceanospirillaceae bacterium]|nr:heme NO-binding domain-containing protein [Oceanospirillaceae bacterium]MCP5349741.1 heme NO-binding domain-containing protein [Oceanospirillaceae bacterium]